MFKRTIKYFTNKISNDAYHIEAYVGKDGEIRTKDSRLIGILLPSEIKERRIEAVKNELQEDLDAGAHVNYIKHYYYDGKIIMRGLDRKGLIYPKT